MPTFVMDACAMVAFLCNEDGAEGVEGILLGPGNICLAHSINLCEVYYNGIRDYDEPTASQMLLDLQKAGIKECKRISRAFWKEVGLLRQTIRSAGHTISLADCFAIVLSIRENAAVVTSDHHEFDYIHDQKIARVNFIR